MLKKIFLTFVFGFISVSAFAIPPDIEFGTGLSEGEYLKNFESKFLQTGSYIYEPDTSAAEKIRAYSASEIVDKAVANCNLLRKDILDENIDKLEYIVKRSEYLPKLKFELGYTKDSTDKITASNSITSGTLPLQQQAQNSSSTSEPVGFGAGYNISFVGEYVIWSGGYYENQARKQKYIAELKTEITRTDRFDFQFETLKSFYDYLLTENFVKLYRGLLDYNYENVRYVSSQINKGVEIASAIYNAKNELKQAQLDFENVCRDNEMARAILNTYINEPAESPILTKSEFFKSDKGINYTIGDLLKIGSFNRGELKQADIQKLIAVYDEKSARAQYYKPRFKLIGMYGYLNSDGWSLSSDDSEWKIKAVAEMPLFDGWKDSTRIQQAKMTIDKIRAERKHYELLMQLEIRRNHRDFYTAKNEVEMMNDRVNQNVEELKIQKANYEKGVVLYKDFLAFQKMLLINRIKHCKAQYNFTMSLLNLKKSLGLNYNVEIR